MQITKALVADYANITRENKLNVLGIFGAITAASFPTVHPQMQLIFMWEADRSEAGKKRQVQITLVDEDGKKLFGLGGDFLIPTGMPGKRILGNEIIGVNNLKFDKQGLYCFNIHINDDLKGEAPFEVIAVSGKK